MEMLLYEVISINGGETVMMLFITWAWKVMQDFQSDIEPPQPAITESTQLLKDNELVLFY